MVREQSKTSTIISLCLHIGVIGILFIFSKSVTFLVPSRSDGMEVALVAMPNQTITPYVPKVKVVPTQIQTQNTPADVNLKQNVPQPKPKPTLKPVEQPTTPPTAKPTPPAEDKAKAPAPTNNKAKVVKNQKALVNDLLGDVTSTNTTAIRKGKALGGSVNGTSNSNNLTGGYADQVVNAVRPFVLIPDDINPNAKAVVEVTLNPNLSVRKVALLKSSGNAAYDQNIQNAIARVKIFPPLPDGADFLDFRVLKLTFRPQ